MNVLFLNKILKYIPISFIALFSAFSCTKVVEVDIPEREAKAVVYCLFKQEDTMRVRLTKSKGILDDNEYKIENAKLYLLKNNVYIDTLHYEDSLYVSNVTTEINLDYQIICEIPGMGVVHASDKIPDLPVITETEISEVSINPNNSVYVNYSNFNRQLKFTLLDTPGKDSFYEIYLAIQYYDSISQQNVLVYISKKTNDPIIENEDILRYYPQTYVFSDELFKDASADISIYYKSVPYPVNVGNLNPGDTYSLVIVARSISEDYYRFRKKLFQHLYYQDNDVWDGVGAPVQMYTNIDGGYGIFAGYSEVHKVFYTGIKE